MALLLIFVNFEGQRESLGIDPSGFDVKLKVFRIYTSKKDLILAIFNSVLVFILRFLYESLRK